MSAAAATRARKERNAAPLPCSHGCERGRFCTGGIHVCVMRASSSCAQVATATQHIQLNDALPREIQIVRT
eukprot:5016430-Alexandrium_andersonii.AAC.1